MSTIKDITVKVGKNRYVTTTVILYSSHMDNEYTVPQECNSGYELDYDQREFIRETIESKISKIRINDELDDISDDYEDMDVHTEEHY